ncbi:hypothetical protein [Flocculibacter collagenilyticus]|uniref:hypothetical protein n=1 Tax=Flocculibacter collagenilyticus TaxID=2744479 RepID=UPI0018F5BC99|nr:hypothetical protein [Flocculibacter collagenilyticus]
MSIFQGPVMKRTFRTQLDFVSILKISATLGFGGGIFMSIFMLFSGVQFGQLIQGVLGLLLAPIFSAVGGLISGTLGFPFYYWYANKLQGQTISGKFAENRSSNET